MYSYCFFTKYRVVAFPLQRNVQVYIPYPVYMIRISYSQLLELVFARHTEDRIRLAKAIIGDDEE